MKALLLLCLFIPYALHAAGCAEVNLVTRTDSPFKNIPVYDQDGIGICYAYAASQLADYHLIKNGGTRAVHPLWVALKYAEETGQKKITAGVTSHALEELRENGNCHRSYISKSLSSWAQKANIKEAQLLGFIEKLVPKMNSSFGYHGYKKNPFSFIPTQKELDAIIQDTIKEFKPSCSTDANLEKLIPDLRNIYLMSSRTVLASLVFNDCKKLTKLDIPAPASYQSDTDSYYPTKIKNLLDKTDAPVSISYCSKVLKTPAYDGVSRKTIVSSRKFDSKCGAHESLIVGKKPIDGQCHYLLRNTWGSGFGSSTKNWKCLCKNKKTGKYLDNCSNDKHNNGTYTVEGCWISESALSKNTFRITNLEAK